MSSAHGSRTQNSTRIHSHSLSYSNVEQIRSSLGHLQRIFIGFDSDELERFLKLPVTGRWQDIGRVNADEHTGELLLRLPSLTKLILIYREFTAHVDFLSHLPFLTVLHLVCHNRKKVKAPYVPADTLVASLMLCPGLTELDHWGGLNSAHWAALFVKLTQLKKLTIRQGDLETLAFFAAGPITHSLEELALAFISLAPSEVSHLYALRCLRTLYLDCCFCFSSRLADATIDSLSPPSLLLPSLTELSHVWLTDTGQPDSLLRKGQSMQERWPQ